MTLWELYKRTDLERDGDKVLVFEDENGGWCNVDLRIDKSKIALIADTERDD